MDRLGDGVGRSNQSAAARSGGGTLKFMFPSAWFWMGWACLAGALAGVFDDRITAPTQFLLLCVALLAFDRYQSAANSRPTT